ncbi:ty3-gypsy retrotransposon protein [Cucumis melo var. makuwa]|uniref:Ty3-gypsy retrotransposon protein n=1 Tax=Cucumis melo var. makuwa TaxID=1194695 RepID=A0A5A7URT5_CUCMM|nr:ty3-gypsy retrotransposon protein [Cucumis melo var. makuwa]TYJ98538.1 ty3-gypsy retrotransposon protein [Cucumis melo var. makuwa]
MAKKSEERLDFVKQEILEIHTELKKLPAMKENMSLISKSIENINIQMEKQQTQQQTMLKFIKGIIREKAVTKVELQGSPSGGMGSDAATETMDGELKMEQRNEDERAFDRSKFKKVEMPIFNETNSDSWFQTVRDGTLVGRFLTIKQETTIEEYRNRFDKYLARVAFLQMIVLEETFMNGLSPWLKTEVEVLEPKFQYNWPKAKEGTETKAVMTTIGGNIPMRTVTLRGVTAADNRREGPSKRLTDAEFQARREKGLCFKCEEKYYVGHHCKAKEHKEPRMLVVCGNGEEFEILEEDGEEEVTHENVIEVGAVENLNIELSINSVVGLTNPGTMKVKGRVKNEEVVVLIDWAAIKRKGICGKVEIMLGDWKVVDSFLPLELKRVDVILGMQLLHSLRPYQEEGGGEFEEYDEIMGRGRSRILVESKAIEGKVTSATYNEEEDEPTVDSAIPLLLRKFEDVAGNFAT